MSYEFIAPMCHVHGYGGSLPCPYCVRGLKREDAPPEAIEATNRAKDPKYAALEAVLARAVAQASDGKGKERHAFGEPFEEQKICQLNRWIGSPDGAIFQACKKAIESKRLPKDAAVAELLGAINYLAAAVILREEMP